MQHIIHRKWWKEVVVYQLYPRSFKDSNGDGIGDLKGIIEKLDYIKSLGIDVVWLNPVYESPNDDMGYDISDYRAIMKQFGSMEDFDLLLEGMHRGIKLIMDLVVNHTSDEHDWFRESRKSRDNPYRNYYHWWDAEKANLLTAGAFLIRKAMPGNTKRQPTVITCTFLVRKQPDLNWENPEVRKQVYDMMRWWMDKVWMVSDWM